eukprot:ANDGO_06100.mRNA.1 hypothetical protein
MMENSNLSSNTGQKRRTSRLPPIEEDPQAAPVSGTSSTSGGDADRVDRDPRITENSSGEAQPARRKKIIVKKRKVVKEPAATVETPNSESNVLSDDSETPSAQPRAKASADVRESRGNERERPVSVLASLPLQSDPQLSADMHVNDSDEEKEPQLNVNAKATGSGSGGMSGESIRSSTMAAGSSNPLESFTLSRKQNTVFVEQPVNGNFRKFDAGQYDEFKASMNNNSSADMDKITGTPVESYPRIMQLCTRLLFCCLVLFLGALSGISIFSILVRYGTLNFASFMVFFVKIAYTLQMIYMSLLMACNTIVLHCMHFFKNRWRWCICILLLTVPLCITIALSEIVEKVEYANRSSKSSVVLESDVSYYASMDLARGALLLGSWVVVVIEGWYHM